MVEALFLVRGHAPSVDRWMTDLLAVWRPVYKNGKPEMAYPIDPFTKKEDKTKPKVPVWRRLGVKEYRIVGLFGAKEELDTIMNISGVEKGENYLLKRFPLVNKLINMIKKRLKLKDLPEPTNPDGRFAPNQVDKAVSVIPLGYHEDEINADGYEMV